MPAGMLDKDSLPAGVDLLIAAHSHDFIGRATRRRCAVWAIGYHPSLLPLHRGRDAVRWTVKMRDRVTGGTVYWLSDNIDAGDIDAGTILAVPQHGDLATWEPSWERQPLRRPDLLMIGQGLAGFKVEKMPSALHR